MVDSRPTDNRRILPLSLSELAPSPRTGLIEQALHRDVLLPADIEDERTLTEPRAVQ
jgi:hypothetical protein